MDEGGFASFLKRGGRKPEVTERVMGIVRQYESFLQSESGKELETSTPEELDSFVSLVECEPKKSAKTHLWAIRYYYQFTANAEMEAYTASLREERITRKPFNLRDFRGVDPEHVAALQELGIRTTEQMLVAGRTPSERAALAEKSAVPVEAILEFVKLSDLARIPGIKSIRARLYYDAGVDSIEKMAGYTPEQLLAVTCEFVERTGFDGIPPLPAEVRSGIGKARRLPKIIED